MWCAGCQLDSPVIKIDVLRGPEENIACLSPAVFIRVLLECIVVNQNAAIFLYGLIC